MQINSQANVVMWVLVIIIAFSLFLPWVKIHIDVDSEDKMQAIKELFKKEPVFPRSSIVLSGYDIPVAVNGSGFKILSSAISFFTGTRQELILQSFLPLTVPFIAVICGLLGLLSAQGRFYAALLTFLSGGLGGAGFYKLYQANIGALFVDVEFHVGIYIILACFCVIGFIGLLKLFMGPVK